MASKEEESKARQDEEDDMSSDDEEYVPKEDDPEELEERALDAKLEDCDDDLDDPESSKGGKKSGSKRKAGDAGLIAGRARVRGGIMLEGEEDMPAVKADPPAEDEEDEEDEEAAKPAASAEAPKPKSKVDDLWEEMKRGAVEKKPKSSGNLNAFIQGLVSKNGGNSSNVAAMFPTTVKQKQTYKVEQKMDFAGEKVVVEKEVEVGSAEDKKQQSKGPKKNNLDDLVARITGKQKKMTTQLKTEHDWNQFKSKAGLEDELQQYRKDGYLEKQRFLKDSDAKLEERLREERQAERDARAKAAHAASLARGPG